jgi:glucokinase
MHLTGPEAALPTRGMISVIGPGTGLGVAALLRAGDHYHVIETEGGHVEYSSLDSTEDAILGALRAQYTRVSAERVVAGPGLWAIYEALAALEGRAIVHLPDAELWTRALDGSDSLAAAAFDRFCMSLGTVAGDIALAQGAKGLVIAGGLGLRIADHLRKSGFSSRFVAKGRFQKLMESIPVKLITHPQPGLYGAAAAFAQEHLS